MPQFLITGTDTGVGKTFITYNIALALRKRGINVKCFKPVETYVREVPEDGLKLARATGQIVEEVVPVTYKLPLAPRAGELEDGVEVPLDLLREQFESLKKGSEVLLVEGAGGIAVPIKKNYTYAHLAKDWNLKVIIVARAGLGTINHTYLTYHYTRSMNLEIAGIVLNGFTGEDVSERTNPQIVYEMTGFQPVCIKKHEGWRVSLEEEKSLLDLIGL